MKNRVGIIGGGQLAQMMAKAAKKLNLTITVLDPTENAPASGVADSQIIGDYTDKIALEKLAEAADFITVEVEIPDEEILHKVLANFRTLGKLVNPPPEDLAIIQDKLKQKEFLRLHSIPTAPFIEVSSKEDIQKAAETFGYPIVLKSRTGGYDGRGNAVIHTDSEIDSALQSLQGKGLYIEQFIPFKKELSAIVARNTKGETASYPILETIHKDNICHIVIAPAPVSEHIKKEASKVAENVLKNLKGAGVYAIELFLSQDDKVLVNEIAPRVHNSGHLTIEANETSQFEQHLRAITGMPLGATDMKVPAAVMINILGEREGKAELKGEEAVRTIPGAYLHVYGKLMTKVQRKMGHITVVDESVEEALLKAKKARAMISI